MSCYFTVESSCSDDVLIMNDTDYQWKWISGQAPNYPDSGPLDDYTPDTQNSGYLLMDSAANVVSIALQS